MQTALRPERHGGLRRRHQGHDVLGKPASVSHTYAAVGSYSVRATLLDALGDTSTASGSVNIVALTSITVGATSPAAPTVGQAVTFPLTFSTTGGSPVQRLVADFGDNSPEASYTGAPGSVSHTYTSPGTFAMRVTGFDSFGNTSTGGASVTVGPWRPSRSARLRRRRRSSART